MLARVTTKDKESCKQKISESCNESSQEKNVSGNLPGEKYLRYKTEFIGQTDTL